VIQNLNRQQGSRARGEVRSENFQRMRPQASSAPAYRPSSAPSFRPSGGGGGSRPAPRSSGGGSAPRSSGGGRHR
jgi:hypothetical protein